MDFDIQNEIVILCSEGMTMEGEGKSAGALALFETAWATASNDFEKSIAAHYVARHQPDTEGKLEWDLIALQHALSCDDTSINQGLASLYLNVAKCYEDLGQQEEAIKNYQLAHQQSHMLPEDGYGIMIKLGIEKALRRLKV